MKLLIVVVGIIFGPLIIFGITKIISKMSGTVKKANPFKYIFWPFVFIWSVFSKPKKLILWAILFFVGYGIYLLGLYCWPTPEKLAFKELSRRQAELELQPEKKKLEEFNKKVKDGTPLTTNEKRQAMEADEKIAEVRKKYAKGELATPPKQVSAKPKEEVWDWTFEWEAATEHLVSNRQKVIGRINDAQIISRNDNVLKFRYKRPSGKIVDMTLDRNDPETEFYFGRASQSDLYIRVWLLPDEKGNFKGQFDNGPGKISIEVFLKKKL